MSSFLHSCLGFFASATVALAAPTHARLWEYGNPFIRNYAQKEYGADSQNWAIVQDPRGLIYVGNNLGLLEYDGSRWRLIQTPRRTTVRSLALDDQGRVYVGAVGEIGYLAPDASGQMSFVDLTPKLEPSYREFSDVWTTASTPQGLLFQSRESLFLWNQGHFQTIKADSTFHLAFAPQGRIFVRQRGIGLMELVDGRLALIPGGERFANESIFTMVPLEAPPSPGSQGRFLIGSRNRGLWSFEGRTLKPFPSEVDSFLKKNTLYHGIRLANGALALATLRGGLALMDPQGRLLGNLTRSNGLQGDNVKHVWEDGRGCLWMALDNGISKVEYPSPFSRFDERFGLKGNVWAIHRHQGQLYAATGQGVFALSSIPGKATHPRFRPLAEISTQALSLLSVEEDLLVATSQGVFAIRGKRVRAIRPSSNVAISLLRSSRNPNRVFVGLQGAFASLLRTPSGWIDEGPIPGVRDDIYSIAESEGGQLWLGTLAQGLIRVRIPQEWKGGLSGRPPEVERFDGRHGLPENSQIYAHRVDGRVLFGTKDGFYGYDEAKRRFHPDARLAGLFPEGRRWIRFFQADPEGRIWANTKDETRRLHETGVALPQPGGSFRWEANLFWRFSDSSVEAIYPDTDGSVWFGGSEEMLRYDPGISRSLNPAFPALIRRVIPKASGKDDWSSPWVSVFPYRQNALRFEFALPSFDHETGNQFRLMLEGYEHVWSPWISEAAKEYTNLPEGRYRFRVQGRNIYGLESPEGSFAFRILPPWYRAWWAYALYIPLGCGGLFLGFRLRTRLLEERNAELQLRVDQATLDLRERERMLATQAGELSSVNADLQQLNLRLQDVNEEKNQFLGIVIHDLRNPLNTIQLASELIGESEDLSEIHAKSKLITRSGTEMNNLIGRFLDIAALDAGRIQPEPEPILLGDLVHEMIERHRPHAQEKAITLKAALPSDLGSLWADPKFIRAVFDNLISNALKFSPPGTTVTVGVTQSELQTELSVQDAGPGLSEEDQKKLFGRFVTLSARPTGGEKSIGLGLSIVKKMLDAMGAQILVKSELGKGSTFRVILPSVQREEPGS